MKNGQEIAKKYLAVGLNPLPIVKGEKYPMVENHNSVKMTEETIMDYPYDAIGVSTGIISGGLEAIDFDLKNASDPKAVMKVFKSKVPKELLAKLVVQQTQSGGYHFIYRCEDISSSKQLAKNPEGKAIIETRGEGGLIKCYPSEGYELLQGSFEHIPIITPEERLQLFVSAKMLNQIIKKEAMKRVSREDLAYFKKFPEYNDDSDIGIDLLTQHGWTVHNEDSEWINLTRPNSKSGDIHAGYHKDGKFLYVFSTAQDTFEVEKPYNNHAIFAMLECGGNFKKAYKRLYKEGYGVDADTKISLDELEQEDWEEKLENLTFLSDEVEENSYLEQARKDEIEQGLPTGWKEVDKHFRFKPNSLNVGLGYDGVGKSLMSLSMAAASTVMHNWTWGMIMPENKTGMSRRRLIEIMSGKPIDYFKDKPEQFDKLLEESRKYFKIMSNKKHYSIEDVIDMGKRLYEYYGIDALLIDPWNFFKVTGDGYSHNNEMLSKLRVFAETYCSVYIMAHPNSTATRMNKDELGFLLPPNKYNIQGGADFPYRIDDFFVFHRVVNHPDRDVRRTMQFIVEKIKEVETGGEVHSNGEYTPLIYETRDGFTGYWDIHGDNPMYKSLVSKSGIREEFRRMTPEEAFGV